ncbi:MAG TPA: hypothetical protein VG122_19190 [Gemmata sp.]|jgi:hypothetical protein|nr:hypothetical protein [Gemmata sp.]
MDTLLERLSSSQIVAVISIVVGGIVAVVMIFSLTKYQLQSLADDTTLKREKQQAELALRTKMLEHGKTSGASPDALLALDATPPDLDGQNAELAKRFGMLEISPDEIERTLARAMALDASRKQTIINVIDELLECEADHEPILAAVRGLCSSPVPRDKEVPVSVTGV